MYIEVGDVDGPIYLTFQTVASENRLFAMKVKFSTFEKIFLLLLCKYLHEDLFNYVSNLFFRLHKYRHLMI